MMYGAARRATTDRIGASVGTRPPARAASAAASAWRSWMPDAGAMPEEGRAIEPADVDCCTT
jgi:hypothetical protein